MTRIPQVQDKFRLHSICNGSRIRRSCSVTNALLDDDSLSVVLRLASEAQVWAAGRVVFGLE